MARKAKQHLRNPKERSASLCGRKSVMFADDVKGVTCAICGSLAVDGTLDELEFEKNQNKFPGANATGKPRFTEMQRKFAASPIVTTNPVRAMVDAGYSEKHAKAHAHALRKQLAPLIMQNQEAAKKISAISVARVQTELAAMGFANIVDYFNVDPETGAMRPKQLNELTRDQAAAIQEVKVVDYVDEETGLTHFVIGSIKLADKRANLVELGKTLGMFNKITIEDKREATMLMSDVPTDALEEAESLLLAAAAQAKDARSKAGAIEGEYKALPSSTEADSGKTEK
jgi:phage terminase small subunit